MDFVHLHTHTCYSLLDGANKIPELVSRAKELGMKALAITDHGVMYGVIEFYKEALKAGIKPIIGCEVYVAPRSHLDKVSGVDDSPYHLVLLAENQEGYQNLIKLVTISWLEGFYYKPRVDKALLKKYSKGLICLSACLAGEIPALLLQDKEEEAQAAALEYQEIYGVNNFFLELQDHGLAGQAKVNSGIIHIAKETNIPLVCTNDIHYLRQEDAFVQDIMLCIQTGKTIQDEQRMRFETNEFYLKTGQEMQLLFGDYPEALHNTVDIAERCQVDFTFGENHMPDYKVPEGYNDDSYLEKLCRQGLKKRYADISSVHEKRLTYELSVIKKMGYSGYFLIVWDFINFAKQNGIFVGPGRGSAAGSLVAYCLGITDIDPLKYDLLFERFLNPERVSMPDIDIDFCYERRGEVIEYVVEKYGSDRVCQIITFGTMAARAAIRDTGRAMNVPLSLVDKVAKLVPMEIGMTLARALEVSPELVRLVEEEQTVKDLIKTAQALEGMPRHAGTHAAGLVISEEPLDHYLPLQKTADGLACTQFEKETVEEIGLLKIDLLGLRTLTVINNTVNIVEQSRNIKLDLTHLDLTDSATYQLLSEGDTIGVFQLESSGLRTILRDLKPQSFEDVIALVALYRPGPLGSGMIDDFIKRRHGDVEISYLHPALEPILKPTYGVIIYQEQVMRIASDLAGFTLGEADLLRRAMGKKKPEIIAGLRQQFIAGAVGKGIEEETAGKIFDLMEYFAGYGFNKSHSAAYAFLAYQTAYLKAHYPVEFMAALLTSVVESKDKVPFYIEECRQRKIEILPPDINYSRENFTVSSNKIRFGMAAIKQVGYQAIQAIIRERKEEPFQSLQDFCERVDLTHINRRVIENLIKAGAFSSVPGTRAQLLEILHTCIERGILLQKDKDSRQMSLFDFAEEKTILNPPIPLPEVRDFSDKEILQMEKEVLGLYLSGHPLAEFKDIIRNKTSHNIETLKEAHDGEMVILAGLMTAIKRTITKRGQSMAYFVLEDLTGNLDCLLFPKKLLQYNHFLQNDMPVLIKGRLNIQEDNPKLFVEEISSLEEATVVESEGIFSQNKVTKIYLKIPPGVGQTQIWEDLIPIFKKFPGNNPVFLYFPEIKKLIKSDSKFWVENSPALLEELRDFLGESSVSLVSK